MALQLPRGPPPCWGELSDAGPGLGGQVPAGDGSVVHHGSSQHAGRGGLEGGGRGALRRSR